jgi:predicted CoA-substrate-specific enzyme activase
VLSSEHYAGIDVGSATTKIVLIDESKEILFDDVRRSGVDFNETVKTAMDKVLADSGLSLEDIKNIISTGYGRKNVSFAKGTKTEISCHGKGAFHYFPQAITVIDIGGQDNKIIKLDKDGKIAGFKMNRKCAAGTGSFLEEIAFKMDISMGEMEELALKADNPTKLNSYCTVFASTEILEKIRSGESKENMLRGAYASVVERVVEMEALTGDVVVTGGVVEFNRIVVDILKERLKVNVLVPPRPQLIGAFGAALLALEQKSES